MRLLRRAVPMLLTCLSLVAFSTTNSPSATGAKPGIVPVASPSAPPAAAAGRSPKSLPRMEVALTLNSDQRTALVRFTPTGDLSKVLAVVTTSAGNQVLSAQKLAVGDLARGRLVERAIGIRRPASATYSVTAAIVDGQGIVRGRGSLVATVYRGQLLTAPTLELLEEQKITTGVRRGLFSRSQADQQLRSTKQARGKGSAGTIASSLAAGITVSGTAKYTDGRGVQLPMRNALVQLWRGAVVGTTRSSTTGAFSISLGTGTAGSYSIRVTADMGNGGVLYPTNQPYIAYSSAKTLSDGMSWTGVSVVTDRDSDTGHAFAALDALKSQSEYYLAKKPSGWSSGLNIRYPSADGVSATGRSDQVISLAGGNVRCGAGWCGEDALDWDVIAHEVGHVVAFRAGMDVSPGGQHDICDDAWTTTGSKLDGTRLAWSEGWATFWGQVSLREVARPAGLAPDIGDGRYNDAPWPPNNGGSNFSYTLETGGADWCGSAPHGESSEMAVQSVLWDLADNAADGEVVNWPSAQIFAALWAAKPTTLTAAVGALLAGRSVVDAENTSVILLKGGLTPAITSHSSGPIGSSTAPQISWSRGGASMHPNTRFTVVVRRNGQSTPLLSEYVGANTSYRPADSQWRSWAAGGGLVVEIQGQEPTAPVTAFTSPPVKFTFSTAPTKVMIVGDSISQGHEGDYTWRYRLANHLGSGVDFVGPWSGTTGLPASLPVGWPGTSTPPILDGAYRPGITFDSDHYARWGRQLHEAKDNIRAVVAERQPNYILLELGFNDLGWGVSGPDGLWADVQTFVREARAARPDVQFLVANVTQRTPLSGFPELPATISSYNSLLATSLPSLAVSGSAVALVDLDGPMTAADTYDGLHPNGVGEFKIAKAFATVLSSRFGLGQAFGTIPVSVPDLVPPTPSGVTAVATDAGITVIWDHSFGASGYWLYQRDATAGGEWERTAAAIPADSWRISWVFTGHTYEFKVSAAHGDFESPTSGTRSVVASPKTAGGPNVTSVLPGSSYIDLSWVPPSGDYSGTVSSYIVYWRDDFDADAWLSSDTTTGTSFRISGLVPGHRYSIAVASVNAAGDGLPSGAMSAVPGLGRPGVPDNFTARVAPDNDYSALLSWSPVATAGYVVQYRNWYQGEAYHDLFFPIVGRTTERVDLLLWDGARAHQFCVKAFNGTLYSAWSPCLIPDAPSPQPAKSVSLRPPASPPLLLKESWRPPRAVE
jgi:lysophospholipase L1-like esterase